MKRHYSLNFENKRQKTLEGQIPKTIAVMLDLEGTSDFIDDEKAKKFITQLDALRKKFGAKTATISISTHYNSSDIMQEALEILARNLSNYIKIGLNFFYGGIYDYDKKEEILKEFSFNSDKVKTFESYYVNNREMNNQWFAIIDDSIGEGTYKKYKNNQPMLVCRPSQRSEDSLLKNNFMSIATMKKGIDGVIEILDLYIESIRSLSPLQVMETQRNMITHLSGCDLLEKVRNRDYVFLERYFREGVADDADYRDSLNWLIYTNSNQIPSRDELIYLRRIFELMSQYFQKVNEVENIEKVQKLQKSMETDNK